MVNMSKEELLIKARIDYPPGTYFKCIFGNKPNVTVAENAYPFDYCWDDWQNRIVIKTKEKANTNDNTVGIYSKQEGWAKILKTVPLKIYELW